jgi:hypothetical protein
VITMFAWPALGVLCLLKHHLSTERRVGANCRAARKCSYQCIWGTHHCTYCFGTDVLPLSRAVPSGLIIHVLVHRCLTWQRAAASGSPTYC